MPDQTDLINKMVAVEQAISECLQDCSDPESILDAGIHILGEQNEAVQALKKAIEA